MLDGTSGNKQKVLANYDIEIIYHKVAFRRTKLNFGLEGCINLQ